MGVISMTVGKNQPMHAKTHSLVFKGVAKSKDGVSPQMACQSRWSKRIGKTYSSKSHGSGKDAYFSCWLNKPSVSCSFPLSGSLMGSLTV